MKLTSFAICALSLASCGADPQYLHEKRPVKVPDQPGVQESLTLSSPLYKKISWFLPCVGRPGDIPASTEAEKVLFGYGPQQLNPERANGVPLAIYGYSCPAMPVDRDILLAVDVTASMAWSDPLSNGSCQRLETVKKILQALPTGVAVGLFTFEEVIPYSSEKFFVNKADLLKDMEKTGLTEVLCKSRGTSDYNLAMRKAKDLLTQSRPNKVQKNLVMISEFTYGSAAPAPAEAIRIAADLRSHGVQIGGETLATRIAGLTIKYNGKPHPIIVNDFVSASFTRPYMAFPLANYRDMLLDLQEMAQTSVLSATVRASDQNTSIGSNELDLSASSGPAEQFGFLSIKIPSQPQNHTFQLQVDFKYDNGQTKSFNGSVSFNKKG